MFRAIVILVPWTFLSLIVGSLFHPMPRIDSVAPIFVGYIVALAGAYWAGRYTRCSALFLVYAGCCSITWVPYYIAYVRSMDWLRRGSHDGPGYWIAYCLTATCFMVAIRFVARASNLETRDACESVTTVRTVDAKLDTNENARKVAEQ